MLVIYFMPTVNPFIVRSDISQLREFPWDTARNFPIMPDYKIENEKFHEIIKTDYFMPNKM